MSSIKILHMADIHIGRKHQKLSQQKSDLRRAETLFTFENSIKRFDDADIILISGDVFEEDCNISDVDNVIRIFNEYSKKYFMISCGNHDCCESVPIKHLMDNVGANVKIFGESIEKICIKEMALDIYGISFSAPHSYTSLISGFIPDDNDNIKLMVVHGDISSDSSYNPLTCEQIQNTGMNYVALGHIHSFSGIKRAGNVCYAYPGVLEPGGFDETGSCGVIYGEVSQEKINLDFYPVSQREYSIIKYDISSVSSQEKMLYDLKGLVLEKNITRIIIEGKRKSFVPDMRLCEQAFDTFFIEFEDKSVSDDKILNYKDEASLRGKTALALESMQNSVKKDVYDKACDILTELMCKD